MAQPSGDAPDPASNPQHSSATPSQPQAKGTGAAPWAADLERLGLNDPRFDQYLRSQWQPRMTQYEQEAAQYRNIFGDYDTAKFAGDLFARLDSEPVEVLRFMAQQFNIDPLDLIEEIADLDDPAGDQQTTQQPNGDDLEAKLRELLEQDPRIQYAQQTMTQAQQAQHDEALEDLLTGIEQHYAGKGDVFNRDLYVHLLKAAEGDADVAYEAYEQFHSPAPKPDDPPPTGGGQKGVTPRQAPQYGSIAEAVSAFASDQRAAGSRS